MRNQHDCSGDLEQLPLDLAHLVSQRCKRVLSVAAPLFSPRQDNSSLDNPVDLNRLLAAAFDRPGALERVLLGRRVPGRHDWISAIIRSTLQNKISRQQDASPFCHPFSQRPDPPRLDPHISPSYVCMDSRIRNMNAIPITFLLTMELWKY